MTPAQTSTGTEGYGFKLASLVAEEDEDVNAEESWSVHCVGVCSDVEPITPMVEDTVSDIQQRCFVKGMSVTEFYEGMFSHGYTLERGFQLVDDLYRNDKEVRDPTTWTILQKDGPNHLGL